MSDSNKKTVGALENIRNVSAEVRQWPRWKLNNTLLAFSEYQRKRSSKKIDISPIHTDNKDIQAPSHL